MSTLLQQSSADINTKWEELEKLQRGRSSLKQALLVEISSPLYQWSPLPSHITTARSGYPLAEPFAQHGVRLAFTEVSNDYINASPIQLGSKRYTAAQRPKSTTISHFYRRLLAEAHGPVVVVKLGPTHKNGVEKCFQYCPLSKTEFPLALPTDDESQDGFQRSVTRDHITYDAASHAQTRNLTLRASWNAVTPHEMQIIHDHFETWPDHAAPDAELQEAVVRLIQLSASWGPERDHGGRLPDSETLVESGDQHDSESQQGRLVVHCSAGCGRIGTFIALDHVLSLCDTGRLDDTPPDKDPVVETVGELRRQRMAMVQSRPRFQFVYDVLQRRMEARMRQR